MHARRTSSNVQEPGEGHPCTSGSPWSRQGGAICSIALLLLGGALVVYGGALLTVGHKPMDEGQAEQWRRIARIRLHQTRQENEAGSGKSLEQSTQQAVQTEAEPALEEPLSKHAAAKIRKVFENIISNEELPRQPGTIGSLSEHLSSATKTGTGKERKQALKLTENLQQIHAANSARVQHRKMALAGS